MKPLFFFNLSAKALRATIKDDFAIRRIIDRASHPGARHSKLNIPWHLWITAVFFFCAVDARSTTIVVVRTPIDVSIASDSVGTFGNQTGSVCKIYRMEDAFLGVAGIANDPVTNFRVSDIVFAATSGKRSLAEKMNSATEALRSRLLAEARSLQKNRPKDFAALIDPEKGGLSIILIGIEDGVPFAIAQSFVVEMNSGRELTVTPNKMERCPGNCPNGVYTFRLGSRAAIERYIAAKHQFSDSAEAARMLVQLEIDDHVQGVGPPIDVLRITSRGPEWVQQKAGCPIVMTR